MCCEVRITDVFSFVYSCSFRPQILVYDMENVIHTVVPVDMGNQSSLDLVTKLEEKRSKGDVSFPTPSRPYPLF